MVCDPHNIQPYAFPIGWLIWKRSNIVPIAYGKIPNPPLVVVMAKEPTIKAIKVAENGKLLVSGIANFMI